MSALRVWIAAGGCLGVAGEVPEGLDTWLTIGGFGVLLNGNADEVWWVEFWWWSKGLEWSLGGRKFHGYDDNR